MQIVHIQHIFLHVVLNFNYTVIKHNARDRNLPEQILIRR